MVVGCILRSFILRSAQQKETLHYIWCDGEQDPSPSAQETSTVRVQPDRRAKTKEPSFRYTA
ncbi:unnamed protein product [Spirodela intermedia]|uniref:Uncharacterized protein n=2 Tax=Spirodela intermedia TaxID=51605 RepID=A0A7I8IJ01_SPIIN|nr:unnamed protein product [Spirodela intermedia]CAA6657878.1 unnamed protein product [Spirodela intermedia]CAB1184611.1 unnamed protein product [Spirodela intermedia]